MQEQMKADILGLYCHARGLGEVLDAPFLMKLERGREPDVLFVSREHLDRLKENYLDGPADLVIEIVSVEIAPFSQDSTKRLLKKDGLWHIMEVKKT
jgi:Uma2 family endonuclease